MDAVINARVAAIIDDSTLVLNAGRVQGVEDGMVFVIFAEHEDITDPETGATLGKWECVKARVVVTHVQEHMCTVRAPLVHEKEVTDGTRPLSTLMVEHSLGRYRGPNSQWGHLDVHAAEMRGRPRDQPVTVGDGARSVPVKSPHPASSAPAAAEAGVAETAASGPADAPAD